MNNNQLRERAGAVTVTVIVVTVKRPECVRLCLRALQAQRRQPEEVMVVDASHDDCTLRVAAEFPGVRYFAVPELLGRMTASRNFGLRHATMTPMRTRTG
jgi:hypothetical protein